MKLPQFTIRELLWSTTLIACGLGLSGAGLGLIRMHRGYGSHATPSNAHGVVILLWVISGALIGAGVLRPLHRSFVGAMWGEVVFGVLYELATPYRW